MSETIGHTRITRDLLRDWGACYSDSELAECFGGFDTLTLLDVLDLPISLEDQLWVFERALPAATLAEIGCCVAELSLPHFEARWPQSNVASKAIALRRGLARGEVAEPEVTDAGAALVLFLREAYTTARVPYHDPAARAGEVALIATECRRDENPVLSELCRAARGTVRDAARAAATAAGALYTENYTARRDAVTALEAAVQQIIRKFIAPENTDGSTPDAADHADDARGLGPR